MELKQDQAQPHVAQHCSYHYIAFVVLLVPLHFQSTTDHHTSHKGETGYEDNEYLFGKPAVYIHERSDGSDLPSILHVY